MSVSSSLMWVFVQTLCCDWSENKQKVGVWSGVSLSLWCVFTRALCVPFCDLSERVSVQRGASLVLCLCLTPVCLYVDCLFSVD